MCGIAGLIHKDFQKPVHSRQLEALQERLVHRGPDDAGIFCQGGVGFAFRRLSIIDLSSAGHQPMVSQDEQLSLVCNGEIYNHLELRQELENAGYRFRSKTDIEVVLHAYHRWGVDCLDHLDGMFAFAIWDARSRQILLARDRTGIKPLCYYEDESRLTFASEIPALLTQENLDLELDPTAFWYYLSEMQIPAPMSPFRRIRKLLPGEAVLIDWDNSGAFRKKTWKYWEVPKREDQSENHRGNRSTPLNFLEAAHELRRLLESSVKSHLLADVPVGAYLSGGVDSSLIVALASQASCKKVKTFSAIFPGFDGVDESRYQKMIVDRYQTDHHEFEATVDTVRSTQELIRRAGEPYAVMSALPLLEVSRLARQHVKVVLSGDGSDEIFAGYSDRYRMGKKWDRLEYLPLPKSAFSWFHSRLAKLGPEFTRGRGAMARVRKLVRYASLNPESRHTERRTSGFSSSEKARLLGGDRLGDSSRYEEVWSQSPRSGLERKLYFEMLTILPDEMLRKVDLCSSAVSLEGRVPFLDRKLVEFGARLPLEYILDEHTGKKLLKEACKDLLPAEILDRSKQGFNVPLTPWMKGLDLERLASSRLPLISQPAVQAIVERHLKGEDWAYPLWILENIRVWSEEFGVNA